MSYPGGEGVDDTSNVQGLNYRTFIHHYHISSEFLKT